jgi:tRNA nucleotidyltransferase (CCA-adding enzyme)
LKGRHDAEQEIVNNSELSFNSSGKKILSRAGNIPAVRGLWEMSNLEDWQVRLEVLIAYLAPEERGKVAANLQLPAESIKRLQDLEESKIEVIDCLLKCEQPSSLVLLLRHYELPMLILMAVQSPRKVRRQIWQYITKWANVEPFLDGNDLKALGYKPGPQFKQMLDDLLAATLDGIVRDRVSAIAFLSARYPK